MAPFSGTYVHVAGDRFIFKGGVTWPNAALPLYVYNRDGTSSAWDYYGATNTWYAGGSFTRPIFDAEGVPFTNYDSGTHRDNVVFFRLCNYIEFDNIEITRGIWTDPVTTSQVDGWSICVWYGGPINLTRLYIHDWVDVIANDGDHGGICVNSASASITVSNCVIRGPTYINPAITDESPYPFVTSGDGIFQAWEVYDCEISNTTQGIWTPGIAKRNYIHDGGRSFRYTMHENCAWLQNTFDFSENVLMNWDSGVGVYILPAYGDRTNCISRFWNNIVYNVGQVTISHKQVDSVPHPNVSGYSDVLIANNILYSWAYVLLGTQNGPFHSLTFANNIIQDDFRFGTGATSICDPLIANYCTNFGNILVDGLFFLTNGMTTANYFAPTGSVALLRDQGGALAYWFTDDRLGVTRPAGAAWDIGVYEYGGSAPVITAHPQNITVEEGQSATFTVTATGDPPLTYRWLKYGVPITSYSSANTYTIYPVATYHAGSYSAQVLSGLNGLATSSSATLTVNSSTVTNAANKTIHRGRVRHGGRAIIYPRD